MTQDLMDIITKLEKTNLKEHGEIARRLDRNETETKYIKESLGRIEGIMEKFIISAEKKYANKWVEVGMKWGVTLILGLVITTLVSTIIN